MAEAMFHSKQILVCFKTLRCKWKIFSVLKRDRDPESEYPDPIRDRRDWKFRLRSGPGGIGIGNFNLVRDRTGSGFDRVPECLNIFRGKKLLCEVLTINF
jgi:hypothetical protein